MSRILEAVAVFVGNFAASVPALLLARSPDSLSPRRGASSCMEQSKRDRSPILRMERPAICWSAVVCYFVVEVDPENTNGAYRLFRSEFAT